MAQYYVYMNSDVYGGDQYGPYDSFDDAVEAVKRLIEKVNELRDGVSRKYEIELTEED